MSTMRIYADVKPVKLRRRPKPSRRPDKRVSRRARASNPNAMMLPISAIILIAVLITMGYLAQRSAIMAACSQIDVLEENIAAVRQVYNKKCMELAELNSMAKVEKTAREKLGMVDATSTALVLVERREVVAASEQKAPSANGQKTAARLQIEVPTVLAVFGSWLKSTAISATSSMISTWHANANGSLPDVLQ